MPTVFSPNRALEFSRDFCLYWADFRLINRRYGWLCEEKTHEKTTIENKKPDESMNKQNR